MNYQTLQVRFQEPVCFLRFYRPEANNTINSLLIEECAHVLSRCQESITIIVLEGMPEVFCFGADFAEIYDQQANGHRGGVKPLPTVPTNAEPLYNLWLQLATGPYITISHVRGAEHPLTRRSMAKTTITERSAQYVSHHVFTAFC